MNLEEGILGKGELIVTDDKTASKVGSGGLDVFATPVLIALAEKTALESVSECFCKPFPTKRACKKHIKDLCLYRDKNSIYKSR